MVALIVRRRSITLWSIFSKIWYGAWYLFCAFHFILFDWSFTRPVGFFSCGIFWKPIFRIASTTRQLSTTVLQFRMLSYCWYVGAAMYVIQICSPIVGSDLLYSVNSGAWSIPVSYSESRHVCGWTSNVFYDFIRCSNCCRRQCL